MRESKEAVVAAHERESVTENASATTEAWVLTETMDTTWTISSGDTTVTIGHKVERSSGWSKAEAARTEVSEADAEKVETVDSVATKEEKKELPVGGQSRGQLTILALAFAAGILLMAYLRTRKDSEGS